MIWAFNALYNVFSWLLIFRVIISFMQISPSSPPVRILYTLTEPFLAPVRRAFGLVQLGGVSLDVSPIVVLVLLDIVKRLLYYI